MADTTTNNLGLTKPEVGASRNDWGAKTNQNWNKVDELFRDDGDGTGVGFHIGEDKVLRIDGTVEGSGAPRVIIPRGHIDGLILRNSLADANNDIIVGEGEATSDDGQYLMKRDDLITKRLDALWSAGSGQGGLANGLPLEDTWYHVFLIARLDTDVVDVLFADTMLPNLPLNYTKKRRIGSVYNRTGGTAGIIKKFEQLGNWFEWSNPVVDFDSNDPGTHLESRGLTVPRGVRVLADISPFHRRADGLPSISVFSSDNVENEPPQDAANDTLNHHGTVGPTNANTWQVGGRMLVRTTSGGNINTYPGEDVQKIGCVTHGWYDFRGRDA
jgi:hypothetical protein